MRNTNIQLKKKIMRRVYAIWLFKKMVNVFTIEVAILTLSFFWLTSYISFQHVFANITPTLSSPTAFANFFVSAFLTTEAVSRVLFIAIVGLLIPIIKSIAEGISQILRRKKASLNFVSN